MSFWSQLAFNKRCFAAMFLAAFISISVGQAAFGNNVSAEGKTTVDRVVNLFSMWTGKASSKAVFKEASNLIDYDEMSEKALNHHWENLKPAERREFVSTFRTLIEEKYYRRWHKIFMKGQLAYNSESPAAGDLFIRTTLKVGKKQDRVVWRLSKRSGEYRVVSIAVNQKDLLDRLSVRLDQRLRKDNFKGLLTWMREEADLEGDDYKS